MPMYCFTGRLTLDEVLFYISAPTREDAIKRVTAGDHVSRDLSVAETVDCEIDLGSIEEAA